MKITLEFLKKNNACTYGIEFVQENGFIGMEAKDFILKLIDHKKLNWANWLIALVLNKLDKVRYAVYAAEAVIDIYEKKYPNDDRPRKAIEAAKVYIANPSEENAAACGSAAFAARSSACGSACAAYAADAAFAARSSAYAADAYAAEAAAYAAGDKNMLEKIISYGLTLLSPSGRGGRMFNKIGIQEKVFSMKLSKVEISLLKKWVAYKRLKGENKSVGSIIFGTCLKVMTADKDFNNFVENKNNEEEI